LNQNPIFEMVSSGRRWISAGGMIHGKFAAQCCRKIKKTQ
jgi:hypothetical protein